MGKLKDEKGNRYGKLVVIERDPKPHTKPYWICQCDCGSEPFAVYGNNLRNGTTTQCKQCGYKQATEKRLATKYQELKSKKFGHLQVIEKDEQKIKGAGNPTYWICKCDCGNTVSLTSHQLLQGLQITCGNKCIYRGQDISLRKTEDLTQKTFGELLVLDRDKESEQFHISRISLWKCKCKCGNIITASRTSLINGTRQCCNICLDGKSIGEKKIEAILLENNIKFQREVSFPDLKGINGGNVRFDFALYENDKIIRLIEFDGEFHYIDKDAAIWNSESVKTNDIIKTQYCKDNNIPLIRIPYWERGNINLDMIIGEQFLCEKD